MDEFARELEQEKKIRSQAKTPRWVLSPNSPKRICWDLLGVIVLLYDLIMIPLYTAFPLQDNIFLSMMTGITLAFWSLDILACFCVGYYAKDGTLVVSLARIAKQHLGRMLIRVVLHGTTGRDKSFNCPKRCRIRVSRLGTCRCAGSIERRAHYTSDICVVLHQF